MAETANIFDTLTPEEAIKATEVKREGNAIVNIANTTDSNVFDTLDTAKDAGNKPIEYKEPTISETIQLLRGGDIEGNAKRMGFNIIPEFDEISGEELNTGTLTMERDGESFKFNPNDTINQLVGTIRPTAQAVGSVGAAVLATPESLGTATLPAAILGGTAGGQLVDTIAEFFSDSGRSPVDVLSQGAQDLQQETMFGLGGEVGGRLLKPVIQKVGEAIPAIKNQIDAARGIEPTKPATRIEPKIEDLSAPTTKTEISDVAKTLTEKQIPRAVEQVRPRSDIVTAAREEGFNLTPDQYSGNPAFIELAQAAKSSPGSTLAAKEIETINKIGKQLDELKLSVGGDIDKAAVNQNVARSFTNMVETLKAQEEKIYDRLADNIPIDKREIPVSLMEAVNAEARRVGGKKNLSGVWAQVNRALNKNMLTESAQSGPRKIEGGIFAQPKESGKAVPKVTYGFIDELRKDVASGYKNQGNFKDAATGQLDQVYKALSKDQQAIANGFGEGVGADMRLAQKLSAERIGIQKNAVQFGKNLVDKEGRITDGPFVQKLESAITNLARGNTKNFDDLMKAIPKDQRTAIAISSIDPLLSASRIQSGKVTGTMANAGRALARNPTAKAKLYQHLPPETAKRLDNLFLISDGVFSSVERQNVSRTARDVLNAMDDQLGPLQKLYNTGKSAGRLVAPKTTTAVDVGGAAVKNITGAKSTTAEAADKLISSPKFNSALNDFVGDEQFRANKIASETKEYKQWVNTLPKAMREDVERVGVFNWMFRIGSASEDAINKLNTNEGQ